MCALPSPRIGIFTPEGTGLEEEGQYQKLGVA